MRTLILALILAGLLVTAVMAQETTPEPAPPATSEFDFNLPVPQVVILTATPPASLSGVSGTAAYAAVSIRSGPGLEYRRIGALAQGRSIDIIGYNGYDLDRVCSQYFSADLDMWVEVQFGERRGWMARCALTITGEHNMPYMIRSEPPPGSTPPRTGEYSLPSEWTPQFRGQ